MAQITLRLVKNAPMTNKEIDDNFDNLNQESANTIAALEKIEEDIGNVDLLDSGDVITAIADVNGRLDLTVGNLEALETTETGDIVGAINELVGFGSAKQDAAIALDELSAIVDFDEIDTGNILIKGDSGWESANLDDSIGNYLDENEIKGGAGSGLFNTEIQGALGAALTTTTANVLTAPVDTTYILHSLQMVNLKSENNATATVSLIGPNGTSAYEDDITLGENVPVYSGTSMEFFKKPKVLLPGDSLRLTATENDALFATVTYEATGDTDYFGAGFDVITADTDETMFTADANSVLESFIISNDASTETDVLVRAFWTNNSDVVQGYFAYDINVPYGSTVELLEKPKFIPNGFKLKVRANMADRVEAVVTGKKAPVEN